MFSFQQGSSFQNVPLPHQDPFSWLSGKYDSRNIGNGQSLSHPPSRFERETLHTMKQIELVVKNGSINGLNDTI